MRIKKKKTITFACKSHSFFLIRIYFFCIPEGLWCYVNYFDIPPPSYGGCQFDIPHHMGDVNLTSTIIWGGCPSHHNYETPTTHIRILACVWCTGCRSFLWTSKIQRYSVFDGFIAKKWKLNKRRVVVLQKTIFRPREFSRHDQNMCLRICDQSEVLRVRLSIEKFFG